MVAIDARMFCHPIHTGVGQVTVRPIAPGDADMVLAFVGNLSDTSRYFRFFQPLKVLSPSMLKRLTCIDDPAQVTLVAVVVTAGRKSIIGEARYCGVDGGVTAEIAIVVADEWQRRGLGRRLLRMLERIAIANGITRLTGESFASNDKFRSFAQASGFETWSHRDPSYVRFEKGIGGIGLLSSEGYNFSVW
jgi:acetyltransferase